MPSTRQSPGAADTAPKAGIQNGGEDRRISSDIMGQGPNDGDNTQGAIDFLQALRPNGPWVLTAIVPDKSTTTVTVRMADSVEGFVCTHNGRANLYYSVNPARTAMHKKAAKVDIAAVEYALADLDPNDDETSEAAKTRYLQQLKTFEPKPTAIIDSGNGIQCLWRLQEPIILGAPSKGADGKLRYNEEDQAKIADVEARIAGVMIRLGAKTGTQNIDRILRLPGTTNLPNAKKLKTGRVPCPTKLIYFNGASYPLSAFPKPQDGGGGGGGQNDDLADLDEALRTLIKQGAGEKGERSEKCIYVACALLRASKSDEMILGVLLDKANGISAHCYDQNDPHRAAGRVLAEALRRQPRALPPIRYIDGEIARVVDEAEAALITAQVPIMVRAGTSILVIPVTEKRPASDDRETEVTILRALNSANMGYLLNKHAATFIRFDGRKKCWQRINPPGDVTHTLITKNRWKFARVTGVITAPTLRPDGSVLRTPGYDPATRLWHMPDASVSNPPVSDRREDAEASLQLLNDLLSEFPFATCLDRSVGLVHLMTPVLRGACDIVPLLLALAPTAGSGKSFLADLASIIVRGMPCPVISVPDSLREMESRLGAIMLEGPAVFSLDNCTHDLGGELLCQLTERPLVHVRILGKSEAPEVEWRGTVFANGNNIRLLGDMTRRALQCNLNPEMEKPERRRFKHDPVKLIMANRAAYVGAILTIARAYLASDAKVECEPIASYSRWSWIVREPLIWLGEQDPVKSMDQARDLDPQRVNARELIEHWKTHLTLGQNYTAREIIEDAEVRDMSYGTFSRPEFRDLLLSRCGTGTLIEPRKLGNWLMLIRDQVHDGYRIELVRTSVKHGNQYRLIDTCPNERKGHQKVFTY